MTAHPLEGKRIVITRPEDQAGEMAELVRHLGGTAVLLPMIRILPAEDVSDIDRVLRRLEEMDAVVFTSANAVRFTAGRLAAIGLARSVWEGKEIYAVGDRTAEIARESGLQITVVPGDYSGAALAKALSSRPLKGRRVLFPRGDLARDEVMQAASAAGAEVVPVVVYRTAGPDEPVARLMRQEVLERTASIVTFASPSAARHFQRLFTGEELTHMRPRIIAAAIGVTTRDAMRSLQLPVQILAPEASAGSLVAAIVTYVQTLSYA